MNINVISHNMQKCLVFMVVISPVPFNLTMVFYTQMLLWHFLMLSIFENSMFLFVGSFVRTFTHQWEGGSGRFICHKNRPGPRMNFAGVISGSRGTKGVEGPPAPREKFKYLQILIKFEPHVLATK